MMSDRAVVSMISMIPAILHGREAGSLPAQHAGGVSSMRMVGAEAMKVTCATGHDGVPTLGHDPGQERGFHLVTLQGRSLPARRFLATPEDW